MRKSGSWNVVVKLTENFANEHHQMQNNCNNCFWWKQHNSTLHQTKISKHEYGRLDTTLKTYKNALIYLILLNTTIFSSIPNFHTRIWLFLPMNFVQHCFHPKQLLRILCIWWYLFAMIHTFIKWNATRPTFSFKILKLKTWRLNFKTALCVSFTNYWRWKYFLSKFLR